MVISGLRPDAVVLSVSGGGLLAGVDEGLMRNGLDNVPVFAIETEGMSSYRTALEAGKPVPVAALSGVATTLGARQVCQQAYEVSQCSLMR